jgi:hypothetical protein
MVGSLDQGACGLVSPHGPTGPQSRSRNEDEFFLEAQPLVPMSTAQARPNDGRGPLCPNW